MGQKPFADYPVTPKRKSRAQLRFQVPEYPSQRILPEVWAKRRNQGKGQ